MRDLQSPIRVAVHYCLAKSDVCDSWDVFIGVSLIIMFVSYYFYAVFTLCTNRKSIMER
uniref:7 kDa protein n=1 Tax=Grapevine leafroll-associated virus 3 TaxID=55951 RepID=A0A2R2Y3L7_9CLOS|nr:7 kDa protein [Grapevine leafroll-associated virus 3]